VIAFIDWTVSSELIPGYKTPNLYGVLFVTGLIIGYFLIKNRFKKEGISDAVLDKLVLYMVLATIVGARLGHVFFYGPYWDKFDAQGRVIETGYFSHPEDIIKVWEGGLASHGAALLILISLYFFSKRVVNKPYLWILDRVAASIAIAGCFIRLGNLVNHEIVGDPTTLPWAFSFHNYYDETLGLYDPTPRHPAQLYEAICYLMSFVVLFYMQRKGKLSQPGYVFGSFLMLIFGARFLVEFVKVGQTARDYTLTLNTGQMLSIPLVLAGVYLFIKATKTVDPTKG
jgi:phosphatidylglycerol:prolipoprotein diacylglycerol transferase